MTPLHGGGHSVSGEFGIVLYILTFLGLVIAFTWEYLRVKG